MPSSLRILTIVIVMGGCWGYVHGQCDVLGGPSVPLYWDANGEPNIDLYNVYRSQNSGSGYSVIGTAAQSPDPISFVDTTPLPTGFYVVTAVNTSGLESGFSDELCVTLADDGGTGGGGGGANNDPIAVADSASTNENVAVTIDVLSNDSDPDGDSLTVNSVSTPTNGSVVINVDQTVTYTPNNNFDGSDSFSYTVADGQGGTDTATVSVSVLGDGVDDNTTVLAAQFMNGNDAVLHSRVYLWNPSSSAGGVTVRVFTLPVNGGTAQELTDTPLNLGTLGAESGLNVKLADDILTPLGTPMPYMDDGGNLTLEFTIQAPDVKGAAQVFNASVAFGTYPLQEILSSNVNPTVLVAHFMNGNTGVFNSRVYLWNPSASSGNVTVRVFTLPNSGDSFLLGEVELGVLASSSARNVKLAEDILIPLGISLPYTNDGGNLTLEFTIEAPNVQGAAQVFSSDMAFGTYPLQESTSSSNTDPTVLVANFLNGNSDALHSRVYLWNPSLNAGAVTVRVFTLPLSGASALLGEVNLGILGASSARNIKLAEDILAPLGIPLPYMDDGGNLTLEFTITAPNVRGAAQVFNSSLAFGTYPLQEIPSTPGPDPTVLVANFLNGNKDALLSRVYLWNPSSNAAEVTARVFTLPLSSGTPQELTVTPFSLGTLGAESGRNIRLAEDILAVLGIPLPYTDDGGNLIVQFTIQAPNVRGAAQVFNGSLAFGTYPLQ